jgi:hypothetical protein
MPGNVVIASSTIPVGFCSPFSNSDWQFLVGLLYGEADVSVNVHIGEAPPTDLTKIWFKTISGVPDRMYGFASGVWLAKHAFPTGFTVLAPAGTSLADINTLDGGEIGAVTPFTGPMWEEDTDFRAMFPIGPGTFPSGTAINEGDTGGEEKHSLTVPEIPAHSHVLLVSQSETQGGDTVLRLRPNINEEQSDANSADTGGDPTTGIVVPHNTIPPYRARYFIKRTGRTHYRAS